MRWGSIVLLTDPLKWSKIIEFRSFEDERNQFLREMCRGLAHGCFDGDALLVRGDESVEETKGCLLD